MLPLINDNMNDNDNVIHQHSMRPLQSQSPPQQQFQQSKIMNNNSNKMLQMKWATSTTTTSAAAADQATATMTAHLDNGVQLIKQMSMEQQKHEQFFSNNHIIENFIDSVREMNDVVLIPSKLKDLEPLPSTTTAAANSNGNSNTISNAISNAIGQQRSSAATKFSLLNDDLYSYYQMINIIKNDLFMDSSNQHQNSYQSYSSCLANNFSNDMNNLFKMPKRKISRQQQRQNSTTTTTNAANGSSINGANERFTAQSRSVSSNNLVSMYHGTTAAAVNYQTQTSQTSSNGGRTSPGLSSSSSSSDNGIDMNDNDSTTAAALTMMMLPQSINGQQQPHLNARQLTIQFINHLHSLYSILEHFTQAADLIIERYLNEFEEQQQI